MPNKSKPENWEQMEADPSNAWDYLTDAENEEMEDALSAQMMHGEWVAERQNEATLGGYEFGGVATPSFDPPFVDWMEDLRKAEHAKKVKAFHDDKELQAEIAQAEADCPF